MNKLLYIVPAIALTAVCWGVYGPVLHKGQMHMGDRWRPFLCVGIAYLVVAVIAPLLWLRTDVGHGWTFAGTTWSLAAGAAGALGALGIVVAFEHGGSPTYVTPLVFGLAPVVNSLLSIWMAGRWRETSPLFLAGLILVLAGAVTVLVTAPSAKRPSDHSAQPAEAAESAQQPA
jgi:hypothetical protein